MTFSVITQEPNECIRDFVVHLKCEFACPKCTFSLLPSHVKDVLGLYNDVLQTDIIVKANHLKTFKSIVQHAETFETPIRDQSKLHVTTDAFAARYAYQASKYPYKQQLTQGH